MDKFALFQMNIMSMGLWILILFIVLLSIDVLTCFGAHIVPVYASEIVLRMVPMLFDLF